jgi:spoIIIJ-associated protein
MEEIISEGKSIEQAIAFALKKLNISREEAIVEILEEPLGGEFSIGMTRAKVKVKKKSSTSENVSKPIPDTKSVMNLVRSTVAQLLKLMKIEGEIISRQEPDESITIKLNTADNGLLIGPRGETLDDLQYIISRIVNKDQEKLIHIFVDIEEYKEKHINKIINIAKDAAIKVKNTGKEYKLRPMGASDRRIIHTTIKKIPGVVSYSTGDEGRRFITIELAKREKRQDNRK